MHSISNFIYVETENTSKVTDLQRTNEKSDTKSEVDLEGQLMALGERWTVLCTWVEERGEILRITRDELGLLESEKKRLNEWLERSESSLREMDRNPSDNRDNLLQQAQTVAVRLLKYRTRSIRPPS